MQESSLLPLPSSEGPPPPPYSRRPRREPRHEMRREPRPQVPDVSRQLECPYAARLFFVPASDIATRCTLCSRVLGLPPAVVCATPVAESEAASSLQTAPLTLYSCPIWRDSALVELSFAALRHVRAQVDKAFSAAHDDGRPPHNEEGSSLGEGKTALVPSATTFTTRYQPLPVYVIEWFRGSVTVEGKAGVEALGVVELHQIVSGEGQTVFPVRRKDGVHYNTLLMHLSYRLGDPLLFTCTRRR